MSEILLNKFEKEKRVIELYQNGKTIREISKEVHMSFRDISNLIKGYEKKQAAVRLKKKAKNDSPHKNKKLTSQAFKLYRDCKKLTDVAIDLEIPAKKAVIIWSQFLRLERRYECYEFYQVFQYEIPRLLSINKFIKENHINIHNIAAILRHAKDIIGLQLHISILKHEIEELTRTKNNYLVNQILNIHFLPYLH